MGCENPGLSLSVSEEKEGFWKPRDLENQQELYKDMTEVVYDGDNSRGIEEK